MTHSPGELERAALEVRAEERAKDGTLLSIRVYDRGVVYVVSLIRDIPTAPPAPPASAATVEEVSEAIRGKVWCTEDGNIGGFDEAAREVLSVLARLARDEKGAPKV